MNFNIDDATEYCKYVFIPEGAEDVIPGKYGNISTHTINHVWCERFFDTGCVNPGLYCEYKRYTEYFLNSLNEWGTVIGGDIFYNQKTFEHWDILVYPDV